MKNIDILQSRLLSVTIDNCEEITKEVFNEKYGYAARPVLFRKAFREFEIKHKWTTSYLKNALPEKELLEDLYGNGKNKFLTLGEYLQDGTPEYYFKTSRHLNSQLANDYAAPELFDCWYSNTATGTPRSRLSWLYIGKEGTFSDIHQDIWCSSAWNYLVSGIKVWFIYPTVYNEFIKNDKEKFSLRQFIKDPMTLPDRQYKPLICVQEKGDMLFIPGGYYHAVYNHSDTVSLTENFINETNYDTVRTYFRNGKNRQNMGSIEAIIKEGFTRKNF